MKSVYILLTVMLFGCTSRNSNQQLEDGQEKNEVNNDYIKPWGENSAYWEYKGKPILLLGSFNHGHNPFIDGSTLDTVEVDPMELIVSQIDEMVDAGGNVLRCVLDPGSGVARGIDSYKKAESGKLDLNQPEGEYWKRLSSFIEAAEETKCDC